MAGHSTVPGRLVWTGIWVFAEVLSMARRSTVRLDAESTQCNGWQKLVAGHALTFGSKALGCLWRMVFLALCICERTSETTQFHPPRPDWKHENLTSLLGVSYSWGRQGTEGREGAPGHGGRLEKGGRGGGGGGDLIKKIRVVLAICAGAVLAEHPSCKALAVQLQAACLLAVAALSVASGC